MEQQPAPQPQRVLAEARGLDRIPALVVARGRLEQRGERQRRTEDELVLGVAVLLREAVGLPLRRGLPPAANAADVRQASGSGSFIPRS